MRVEHALELGHHWQAPAYAQEIHFQLISIAVLAFVGVATAFITRMRRKRSVPQ